MRLIKFIAAFLVPALLVFLIAFGLNWKSTKLFFENRESMAEGSEWVDKTYSLSGLAQYVEQNPENVSFVSQVLGVPDSTLSYQGAVRRTMGVTANVFLMMGIADRIVTGLWEADEPIPFWEFDRYQLPEVSESSHTRARQLAEERGWLTDGSVTLGNSVLLLAESGSLAMADYFWWLLGSDYFEQLSTGLGLRETDMPLPFSGIYLLISPEVEKMEVVGFEESGDMRVNDKESETLYSWIQQVESEGSGWWREQVEAMSARLMQKDFREYAIDKLDRRGLGLSFMETRDALALFPQTTAREMADLLRRLAESDGIRPEISRQVLSWLRWPMVNHEGANLHFSEYGALYDYRMGLLNGIDIGTSKYTGNTTVQAVFFDRLEIAFWFHMSSNHMHQDFQQRMMYDPAMIDRLERITSSINPK